MDKSFNTWLDLNECAVVSDENDFTLNLVTYLEVWIESIPRVNCELFQAESNSLLGLIEVEVDNANLLVKFDNLFRVIDSAP